MCYDRGRSKTMPVRTFDGTASSMNVFVPEDRSMDNETKIIAMQRLTAGCDRVQVRSHPLEVFSVGRDRELLRRRERAIAGRSELLVRSLTPEEAEKQVRDAQARLWIFCHSIDLGTLIHLACCVRRHSPQSPLVLMRGRRQPGFEATLFHQIVPALEGPEMLIDAVSHLAVAV
jgi:hypothetical protein